MNFFVGRFKLVSYDTIFTLHLDTLSAKGYDYFNDYGSEEIFLLKVFFSEFTCLPPLPLSVQFSCGIVPFASS